MSHPESLFEGVDASHIEAALERVRRDGVPARRRGHNTFVLWKGEKYAAKYVLGLADRTANRRFLDPDQFTGGWWTMRDLLKRGFAVEYKGHVFETIDDLPADPHDLPEEPDDTSETGISVATVCVAGRPASAPGVNSGRLSLLEKTLREVKETDWGVDVVLFPGGFLRSGFFIGGLDDAERTAKLESWDSMQRVIAAARETGLDITLGVDSVGGMVGHRKVWGDQLCVSVDSTGVTGLGRKVCPVKGPEGKNYAVFLDDFSTESRAPTVAGKKALLCSCYDMFGCRTDKQALDRRRLAIEWYVDDELRAKKDDTAGTRKRIRAAMKQWKGLVKSSGVGLVAIHHFSQKGSGSGKGYWQRNGVQRASDSLGGGIAFGAAHFEPPLPAPDSTVLAAKDGDAMEPEESFAVGSESSPAALVRLYRAF
mgnify:CR=1 FL=1